MQTETTFTVGCLHRGMQKIAFLCGARRWEDTEVNLLNCAKAFSEKGYDVNIFCLQNTPLYKEATEGNLTVIPIKEHRKYFDLFAAQRLIFLLEKQQITHLFIFRSSDIGISAMVKSFLKRPVDITFFLSAESGFMKRFLMRHYHFRQLDHIICSLNVQKEEICTTINRNDLKIKVIPPMVPFEENQTVWKKTEARKVLNLPERKKIFGFIATEGNDKAQQFLFSALKQLNRPDLLICLLDKTDKQVCRKRVKTNRLDDKITVLSYRKEEDLFFHAIDVFISIPSNGAFEFKMLEAISFGKQVLTDDGAGNQEILDNGTFGFLYERRNEQSLAEKMGSSGCSELDQEVVKTFLKEHGTTAFLNQAEAFLSFKK